jgi:hypothetical protein
MKTKLQLHSLSDDQLLHRLSELLSKSRRLESELIAHIGEVDARRLYARQGSSSMFSYCTEVLHLSEAEAYLRIGVARAARQYPVLLDMLADGRFHLSGIARLVPHLTGTNHKDLLQRAAYKSKRQIDELIAEIAPKPDVPPSIRKLPDRREKVELPKRQLLPDGVGASKSASSAQISGGVASQPGVSKAPYTAPEPLSPARYKIQFTASAEFRDKLERLRKLLRTSVPDGDLAAVFEVAVTEKLERLESKRLAKTKAPRKSVKESDTQPSSRHIPAAVRRAVLARDGNRCTFVSPDGRRCSERSGLEFHHRRPFGLGGDNCVENISLMCRTHNAYRAECDYGKAYMERCRSSPSRISEPETAYLVGGCCAVYAKLPSLDYLSQPP